MKNAEHIKKEIAEYGQVSLWGCKKEIRTLAYKLDESEKIIALLRVFTSATIGLLVATSRRLILMDNHMVYGTDHKDFSYLQISAVDYNTRMFFGKITIEDQAGHQNDFDYALIKDLRRFVNVVALKIAHVRETVVAGHASHPTHPQPHPEAAKKSTAAELERLWALVEKGALTREEFNDKKKQLLAS
jgi:hypothetical protein